MQAKIKEMLKDAMRAKDSVATTTYRGLLAGFTNELVSKGIPPQEPISDADAVTVVKREVKRRKDSIEQFTAGNRMDLVENETAELKILEQFLPTMMSQDEIKKIAEAKIAELGVADKSGAGKLVGALMKELAGQADGTDVKAVVDELLK
jgi:uncharacterized protein YqeY